MEVYYFDGSGGCDRCKSNTAISLTEPERPHPYCDCPITVLDAEDLEFEIEYRNLLILEDQDEIVHYHYVDNCEDERLELKVELPTDVFYSGEIDDELWMMAVWESSWQIPDADPDEYEITLGPWSVATAVETITRYTADFLADAFMVATVDGQRLELYLAPVEAHFAKNIALKLEKGEVSRCRPA